MVPRSEVPHRSSSLGSSVNTDGVKPRLAGGSPIARPISRCAHANLVTESKSSITSRPWSRKYSAMAVATKAPRTRARGGLFEVETTTTERASPSGPRSFSMNSRTSRPRSPIRAITLTSAEVLRAIMPSSVLLPTPLPEKMPSRCPFPAVASASIERTPVATGSVMRRRRSTSGGPLKIEAVAPPPASPRPSIGLPIASTTRPSRRCETGMDSGAPDAMTVSPTSIPSISS